MTRLSRRALLGAGAGVALGGVGLERVLTNDDSDRTIPFYGAHQAGIATAAQDRLHFAAFDVTTDSRADVRDLLRAWSDAAARMTEGGTAGALTGDLESPPADTGEALGLKPSRLTITFGLGPAARTSSRAASAC